MDERNDWDLPKPFFVKEMSTDKIVPPSPIDMVPAESEVIRPCLCRYRWIEPGPSWPRKPARKEAGFRRYKGPWNGIGILISNVLSSLSDLA